MKSGNLNFLEPSGPLQACNGTALPLVTYILTYLLTPRSRVFLENLSGIQLVNKFTHFMEPDGSLPHLQVSLS